MVKVNNTTKNDELKGLEALSKINEILACPFDGRGIEDDALGYINLLQEAFLYLRDANSELEIDVLRLVKLCKENNLDTSQLNKSFGDVY